MSDNSAADRAETLLAIGRNDEAVVVLSAALATDPDDPTMIRLLASAHLTADRFEQARDAAWRAISLDPDNEWGFRLLSESLSRLGNHPDALRSATESRRLAPYQWRTHTQLALVSARGGWASEGLPAARYAVELAPNEPDTHFVLGYTAKLAGDRDLAEQAYQRTLALKPDHALAMNNLSSLRLRRFGGLRSATRGFGSALAANPQLDIARRNVAVVARRYMRRFHFGVVAAWLLVTVTTDRSQGSAGSDHVSTNSRVAAFAVGIGALLILTASAAVVDRRLPANLRPYFRRLPRSDKWLGAWLAVDVVALAMVALVGAPTTYSGRASVSSIAWVFLLAGLALSYGRRFARFGRGG